MSSRPASRADRGLGRYVVDRAGCVAVCRGTALCGGESSGAPRLALSWPGAIFAAGDVRSRPVAFVECVAPPSYRVCPYRSREEILVLHTLEFDGVPKGLAAVAGLG